MNFNIKNFKTLLFCGALAITSSCSEFLAEEDPSNVTPETFFTIPEHAESAINAIYDNLRLFSGDAGIFSQNFQLLEALSGTSKTETAQNSNLNNLYGFSYTGDNLHLTQWWRELYNGISNANLAIDKIPGMPPSLSESERTKWLGHAYFLRAWHYFYLVRLWGEVPLITKPVYELSSPDIYASRTAVSLVYDQIVSDLLLAESAGLPFKDESGRASQGAIKSLLAKVYLTMAGYPLNKGTEYFQKAADKANEVIASKEFELFDTYNELHLLENKNKKEHIFMVQYSIEGKQINDMQALFHPNIKNMSAYDTEIGTTIPTPAFYNSFEPGDKRTINQKGYFYSSYFTGGNEGYYDLVDQYIFKHFDWVANGVPGPNPGDKGTSGSAKSELNWPLIRYAEVLLIYAEGQNEASGPTTEVLAALDSVRDRAGLPTPALGNIDQVALRELIWQERWHELCFEGITWFDMLRLRKIYVPSSNTFTDFVGGQLTPTITLEEKHLLLPLPTSEVRNNPSLGNNNPGW